MIGEKCSALNVCFYSNGGCDRSHDQRLVESRTVALWVERRCRGNSSSKTILICVHCSRLSLVVKVLVLCFMWTT